MQERGIKGTFKKIIDESKEMVFLADKASPFKIFYSNESFDSKIGTTLNEKTLVGLGLNPQEIKSSEEVQLQIDGKRFRFTVDLPEEDLSDSIVFYNGIEVTTSGSIKNIPRISPQSNFDLFGFGEENYFSFVNENFLSLLGYQEEELTYTDLCDLVHDDDQEQVKKIWEENYGKKKNIFFEVRIKTKTGNFKPIECSVQFLPDRFFITGRDVSDRINFQEFKNLSESPKEDISNSIQFGEWKDFELTENEKRIKILEVLLQESPDPGMVVYPDGKVFRANSEVLKLFGLENEILHLVELGVLFDDSELWKSWIQFDDKESHIQRFSTLLISAQGKQLTLEVASKYVPIEGIDLINLTFKNISEKVTLEKNLEESSDFLMNLTDQVPGGLCQMLLDVDGKMKFSFLSKGISTVLGLNPDEIKDFQDITAAISRIHPLDLPLVIMSSVASARKQEPWQCQFRVKTDVEKNEFKWILGAARPQLLANGDMVWYGYLTDISKQKEFEAKLDEARKTAEKASQIKSDFLSMISHELRTPLNAISGSTYSLLQDQPTDSQKTALNTINFAVDNLIIMINDLLDFQKIEAGKLTIEKTPFHLENLINQIMKGLSFHARDSHNNLNLHTSPGLDIWLKGDKTRLSQILNNLITNALKFTKEGDVDVSIILKARKKKKVRIYFEVKDSGIGIAKENQEMIFNDFDQVKPTFSTKYGGTGLGLSITRKLLDLMGSEIKMESEEGKGSRFYFDLKFEIADEQSGSNPALNNLSTEPKVLNLLMAEDNDVNALVLGKIIKKWGYQFERVYNGQEAVDAAKSNTYDCVLMDIQMPVMDGFDATVAIKSFSNIPVIALTAAAKLEIMEKIDQCGFDGFVAKPIDAAELHKKIKDVVSDEYHKA